MKTDSIVELAGQSIERRDLLKLLCLAGVVASGGLAGCASQRAPATGPKSPSSESSSPRDEFVFLQLSDTHWGYSGPNNPLAEVTLREAVKAINGSALEPDFVVFTGDLTHTTDDTSVRKQRMREFQSIVSDLKVKTRYFLPGEHDAGPDAGETYRELFGETHGAFDHKGVHFTLLDNVSQPGSVIGDAQLEWFEKDVSRVHPETPLVVLTHRPLFELYPSWDWVTRDGARAVEILARRPSASVFYGHIHQEHHQKIGTIEHHAARSLIFPLPAPGAVEKKAALPWDPESAEHGLGYRAIRESAAGLALSEHSLSLIAPGEASR